MGDKFKKEAIVPEMLDMSAELPIVAGQPNAALFEQQLEENRLMAEAINKMLDQQSQTQKTALTLSENMQAVIDSQEDIQKQLDHPMAAPGDSASSGTIFLAGLVLGIVFGLVFASYLIKLGKLGGKRPQKAKASVNGPPVKEFAEIVKHNHDSAQMRTTNNSGSSADENAQFI